MKRQTALKNLDKIIQKVRSINGIYPTPLSDVDFVKIKRMWVFGSVAKGSKNPNDLDIFIEIYGDGFKGVQPIRKGKKKVFRYNKEKGYFLQGCFKKGVVRLGNECQPSAMKEVEKWLRQGTQKTSIHIVGHDDIFKRLDCKYLVYPRNDFKTIGGCHAY